MYVTPFIRKDGGSYPTIAHSTQYRTVFVPCLASLAESALPFIPAATMYITLTPPYPVMAMARGFVGLVVSDHSQSPHSPFPFVAISNFSS